MAKRRLPTGRPVAKLIAKAASVLPETRERAPKINRITVHWRFIGQHEETDGMAAAGHWRFDSILWPKMELL